MTSVLSSKVYGIDAPLALGIFGLPDVSVTGLPFGNASRFVGITRLTPAVAPAVAGNPVCVKVVPTGSGVGAVWGLDVFSSSATDECTYRIEWVNEFVPSQILDSTGAGAGVQFSP